MAVNTSAGTTIGISAATPATYDAAGFAALTFSIIGEITDLGEFGREYALVTHSPLGSRGTQKRKGSFNAGSITLQMALDNDDAGQVLLKTAANSDDLYSFEVTEQDGTVDYFQASVMSFRKGIGGVDSITSATSTLEINTHSTGVDTIEVQAA